MSIIIQKFRVHLLRNIIQGSTLTVVRLPGASEMRPRASENNSVICSIPEEQND